MKLKDIVQITIFTVVAFVLNMAVSTATGMLGTLSLYIAAGFASFVVAPPFIIMAKKMAINSLEPLVAERKRIKLKVPATAIEVPKLPLTKKITKVIIQGSKVKLMTNSRV